MQYRVNLWAANKRAEILNAVLPPLQDEFEASLNRGVLLELEVGETATFVETLLERALAEAEPV